MNTAEFLTIASAICPERPAMVFEGKRYTFGEINERANRMANALTTLGVQKGDRVAILEYAYYSVISPEGCASILWRSGDKAAEAAEAMKITSRDLKSLDVIDDIIPEPLGGAHRNPAEMAGNIERYIIRTLRELKRATPEHLLQHRYDRWRRIGEFTTVSAAHRAQPAEK